MRNLRKYWIKGLLFVAVFSFVSRAEAATWTEVADAGDLSGSAQVVTGVGSLTLISGTILPEGDADMYLIWINGGGSFSATTEIGSEPIDTQLFLFDAAGLGIYANDDTTGGSTSLSTLPAFDPLTPTTAGLYLLAVSTWDTDPQNAQGLIFPSGLNDIWDTVDGPTGPGGPWPMDAWSYDLTGDWDVGYTITLTGASAVPEPATLSVLLLGSLACFGRGRAQK